MRKVILDLAVTLDGYIEGSNGEIDWCIMDDDMDFGSFLSTIDTVFFGRVSFDNWGKYQPDNNLNEATFNLWKNIQTKHKYIFSTQQSQYNNAKIISSDILNKVAAIKNEVGKDIWLFGGASIIKTFIQLNLIDTYRISIHPIVLGSGKPLFENIQDRVKLKLIKSNVFKSGVVQLIYEPIK